MLWNGVKPCSAAVALETHGVVIATERHGAARMCREIPCSSVAINITNSLKNNYLTTNKTEETIEVSMRMNASVLRTKHIYWNVLEES